MRFSETYQLTRTTTTGLTTLKKTNGAAGAVVQPGAALRNWKQKEVQIFKKFFNKIREQCVKDRELIV